MLSWSKMIRCVVMRKLSSSTQDILDFVRILALKMEMTADSKNYSVIIIILLLFLNFFEPLSMVVYFSSNSFRWSATRPKG